jgi:hypothetical protein
MDMIEKTDQYPPKKGFKPGMSGNPAGRPKGAIDKKKRMLDEFAARIITDGMEKFSQELNQLEGKQYTDAFLTLFEFVRGKIARQEFSAAEGQNIEIKQVFLIGGVEVQF